MHQPVAAAERRGTSRAPRSPPSRGRAGWRRRARRPRAARAPRYRQSRSRRPGAPPGGDGRRSAMRSSTIQSGTEAISSDASPIGTRRSATNSIAFAPSRSTPTSTADASPARPTRNRVRPCRSSTHPAIRHAGEDEAHPGGEHRRDRLAGELDPEIRRAPDHVHRPEREPRARAHRFSVSTAPAASRASPSTTRPSECDLLRPRTSRSGRSQWRA